MTFAAAAVYIIGSLVPDFGNDYWSKYHAVCLMLS